MDRCPVRRKAACFVPALALGLVVSPDPCRAAAIGGQDVEVVHLLDEDGVTRGAKLAIASDGTAFVVTNYSQSVTGDQLRIYRSLNGGKTWSAWGSPITHNGGAVINYLDAAIVPGNPEQLVIVHDVEWDIDTDLSVQRADVDNASPSWQQEDVDGTINLFRMVPHVSCIAGPPGGSARIAILWSVESKDMIQPSILYYLRSTDAGATWGATVGLDTTSYGGHAADVALDAGGIVHAAWTREDLDSADFFYSRATDGGDLIGDWSLPVLLRSGDLSELTTASVAASPVSDGVIATVTDSDGTADTYLYISTDAGLTWPHPAKGFASKGDAEAIWGGGGAVVGVVERATGNAYQVMRPLGNLLDLWVAHDMLAGIGAQSDGVWGGVAADESRGGALAMAGMLANLQGVGRSPWFDAEWRADAGWGVPEFEPGFDVGGGGITSAPAVSDLDGDGDEEVVFTANNPHRVARFDLDTMQVTTLKTTAVTSAASAPAIIDIDGDATGEAFLGVDTGRVVGVHEDGASVTGYPFDTGSGAPVWVSCGRITGSAPAEVVAATARSIFVLGPAGSAAPGFPYTAVLARGNVVGRVAIGDVDADGAVELVGAFEHGVVILDGTGVLERAVLVTGPSLSAGVSLADLDGDGDLEIAAPRANGSVALIHHDGTTYGAAWPWNSGTGQPIGSVAISDFFGTAGKDLVFAAMTGEVFAVNLAGTQPAGWTFAIGAHAEDAPEPVVSGLGAVGRQIALGDPDDTGYVRWPTGPQAGWPRGFSGEVEHSLVASDLDGDGNVELVVPAGGRLWVLDMGTPGGADAAQWPMAGARSSRSGCRDCEVPGVTGVDDLPAVADRGAALHSGEPNPFSRSTLLRYDIPAPGAHVRVKVYDVAGRLVRSLADAPRATGSHAVTWDGRDAGGRTVASGVYLVRLDAGAESRTIRVVRVD